MKLLKTLVSVLALSMFGANFANAGGHSYTGPDLTGESLKIFGPWMAPEDESFRDCLLYTSPSPRDLSTSRMPSSA